MILEQAGAPPGWKGVRVYVKMTEYQTSGEKLETMKKAIAQKAGEETAKSMHAALTFEVQAVRPLMGRRPGVGEVHLAAQRLRA